MNCFYILYSDYKKVMASIVFSLLFYLKSYALLVCPPNQTISTQPFACDAQLNFTGLAWSNSNPLTDTAFMPGPGYAFPIGNTQVTLSVTEVGGNELSCSFTVTVVDEVAPVAKCKGIMVVELLMNGFVDVWAVDYDDGSYDNCTTNIKFSFSHDVNDIGNTYSCFENGQQLLELWVTDNSGNQSHCITAVYIQDPFGPCEPKEYFGSVSTEEGDGVNNVAINTSIGNTTTNIDGLYHLGPYFYYPTTEFIPSKDTLPANGVTTFDVVLIRKHILGNGQLGSPYKIIAADANRSNTVTTFDLVVITKVILGNAPNFQNNSSWRFVPEEYTFPDPANPFLEDFPETIEISPSNPHFLEWDFIAIKVGDVNGSASPSFAEGGTEFRKNPNETQNRQ